MKNKIVGDVYVANLARLLNDSKSVQNGNVSSEKYSVASKKYEIYYPYTLLAQHYQNARSTIKNKINKIPIVRSFVKW